VKSEGSEGREVHSKIKPSPHTFSQVSKHQSIYFSEVRWLSGAYLRYGSAIRFQYPMGRRTLLKPMTCRTVQDRTGEDQLAKGRTGQDRTGQDSTGQDRTGQDSTGRHSTAQHRTDEERIC
jgi:hypothetical protein